MSSFCRRAFHHRRRITNAGHHRQINMPDSATPDFPPPSSRRPYPPPMYDDGDASHYDMQHCFEDYDFSNILLAGVVVNHRISATYFSPSISKGHEKHTSKWRQKCRLMIEYTSLQISAESPLLLLPGGARDWPALLLRSRVARHD